MPQQIPMEAPSDLDKESKSVNLEAQPDKDGIVPHIDLALFLRLQWYAAPSVLDQETQDVTMTRKCAIITEWAMEKMAPPTRSMRRPRMAYIDVARRIGTERISSDCAMYRGRVSVLWVVA